MRWGFCDWVEECEGKREIGGVERKERAPGKKKRQGHQNIEVLTNNHKLALAFITFLFVAWRWNMEGGEVRKQNFKLQTLLCVVGPTTHETVSSPFTFMPPNLTHTQHTI